MKYGICLCISDTFLKPFGLLYCCYHYPIFLSSLRRAFCVLDLFKVLTFHVSLHELFPVKSFSILRQLLRFHNNIFFQEWVVSPLSNPILTGLETPLLGLPYLSREALETHLLFFTVDIIHGSPAWRWEKDLLAELSVQCPVHREGNMLGFHCHLSLGKIDEAHISHLTPR